MAKQMLTLKLSPKEATLSKVSKQLNLSSEEIDAEFGIVNIDPKRNLYAVLVEEEAARRVGRAPGVEGPFSNPKIEPFGLEKKK